MPLEVYLGEIEERESQMKEFKVFTQMVKVGAKMSQHLQDKNIVRLVQEFKDLKNQIGSTERFEKQPFFQKCLKQIGDLVFKGTTSTLEQIPSRPTGKLDIQFIKDQVLQMLQNLNPQANQYDICINVLMQIKMRVFREIERFALSMNRLGVNYNPFQTELIRASISEDQTRKSIALLENANDMPYQVVQKTEEKQFNLSAEKALFSRDHFRLAFKAHFASESGNQRVELHDNYEFKDTLETFLTEVMNSSVAIVWLIDKLNDTNLKSSLFRMSHRSSSNQNHSMAIRKKLTDALTPQILFKEIINKISKVLLDSVVPLFKLIEKENILEIIKRIQKFISTLGDKINHYDESFTLSECLANLVSVFKSAAIESYSSLTTFKLNHNDFKNKVTVLTAVRKFRKCIRVYARDYRDILGDEATETREVFENYEQKKRMAQNQLEKVLESMKKIYEDLFDQIIERRATLSEGKEQIAFFGRILAVQLLGQQICPQLEKIILFYFSKLIDTVVGNRQHFKTEPRYRESFSPFGIVGEERSIASIVERARNYEPEVETTPQCLKEFIDSFKTQVTTASNRLVKKFMMNLLPKFGVLVLEGFLQYEGGATGQNIDYIIQILSNPFKQVRRYVFGLLDEINYLIGRMLDFNIQRQGHLLTQLTTFATIAIFNKFEDKVNQKNLTDVLLDKLGSRYLVAALLLQIYFEICFLKSFLDTSSNQTLERRVNSIEQILFREISSLREEDKSSVNPFEERDTSFKSGQREEGDILSQKEIDQKRRAIINLKFRNKVNYQAFV